MLRKMLPVVVSLAAFLGGAAGGEMLRGGPPAEADIAGSHAEAADAGDDGGTTPSDDGHGGSPSHAEPVAPASGRKAGDHPAAAGEHGPAKDGPATAWFKFPQQFLVPILHDGRLDSTMILTLSVEMPEAASETVYAHEIKLRDALLRQLLIHANTGGFDGNFTNEAQLRKLRGELTTAAQGIVPEIADVLIGDIGRQER